MGLFSVSKQPEKDHSILLLRNQNKFHLFAKKLKISHNYVEFPLQRTAQNDSKQEDEYIRVCRLTKRRLTVGQLVIKWFKQHTDLRRGAPGCWTSTWRSQEKATAEDIRTLNGKDEDG